MDKIKTYEIKDADGVMQTFYEGEPVLVGNEKNSANELRFLNRANGNDVYASRTLVRNPFYWKFIKKLHPTVPERWVIKGEVFSKGEKVLVGDDILGWYERELNCYVPDKGYSITNDGTTYIYIKKLPPKPTKELVSFKGINFEADASDIPELKEIISKLEK